MQFIHVADTHVGYSKYAARDEQTHFRLRELDFIQNFETVMDFAIKEHVDVVFHAGDLFHHPKPVPNIIHRVISKVKEVIDKGIPVFIIPGNHDTPRTYAEGTPVRLLRVVGAKVFLQPSKTSFTVDGEEIGIMAIPYAKDTDSEMFLYYLEQVGWSSQTAEKTNVLLAHGMFGDVLPGAEKWLREFRNEPVIPWISIPTEFNYLALGHIHSSIIKVHPHSPESKLAYPGSTERVDFSEEKEEKGFFVVDGSNGFEIESQHLTTRKMINAPDLNISEMDPLTVHDIAIDQLKKYVEPGSLVRMRLTGRVDKEDRAKIRIREIKKAFDQVLNIDIIDNTDVISRHVGVLTTEAQVKAPPLQELEVYLQEKLQDRSISNKQFGALLKMGERIITEVKPDDS